MTSLQDKLFSYPTLIHAEYKIRVCPLFWLEFRDIYLNGERSKLAIMDKSDFRLVLDSIKLFVRCNIDTETHSQRRRTKNLSL